MQLQALRELSGVYSRGVNLRNEIEERKKKRRRRRQFFQSKMMQQL
uniref:Uncharacterized protein n=1 Tax=Anguilla anguilla TaxID=7936 RepID=A0A0E9R752_ANGAN